MRAAAFIHEASRRLEENNCEVLYLHQGGESPASLALVTVAWMDRQARAQEALYAALDGFPEPTNHSHLEGGEA